RGSSAVGRVPPDVRPSIPIEVADDRRSTRRRCSLAGTIRPNAKAARTSVGPNEARSATQPKDIGQAVAVEIAEVAAVTVVCAILTSGIIGDHGHSSDAALPRESRRGQAVVGGVA